MPRLKGAQARLLRAVAQDFLKVPQRLDMHQWGSKVSGADAPPCGTVACIAGRIAIRDKSVTVLKALSYNDFERVMDKAASQARKALGLSMTEAYRLFYPNPFDSNEYYWPSEYSRAYEKAPKGSYLRAGVVAARIEHFIKHGE